MEICRAQIGMDETRIKVLIDKHRQRLNRKIEETLAHAWQEWSAHAAKLHVLRADAENRRKEGRGFYKMDENNIQLLHCQGIPRGCVEVRRDRGGLEPRKLKSEEGGFLATRTSERE